MIITYTLVDSVFCVECYRYCNFFKVSAVCSKSQNVLENVNLTNVRVAELDRDANSTAYDVEAFVVDAEDLLGKVLTICLVHNHLID